MKPSSVGFSCLKVLRSGSFVYFAATYSNLENHPRLIRARDTKAILKIKLDPKTGLPTVANPPPRKKLEDVSEEGEDEEDKGKSFASVMLTALTSDQPRGSR